MNSIFVFTELVVCGKFQQSYFHVIFYTTYIHPETRSTIAGITCRKWCEFICGSGGLVRNFLRNLRLRKADEMYRPYAISFSDGLPYESLGVGKQLVINLLGLFYETITTRACRVAAWFSVFN